MHVTAMANGDRFFRTYTDSVHPGLIVEIGSQNVNGSLRERSNPKHRYIGVDFVKGNGVDMVLEDPYRYPFDTNTVDFVVTSSCFEHSEFFWLSFLESIRILRPDGLLYMNIPSNGAVHRFPMDYWRFYPDAGLAFVSWGERNGYRPELLESYTSHQQPNAGLWDRWADNVIVIVKDRHHTQKYPSRIIDTFKDFTNGRRNNFDGVLNDQPFPEDLRK